MISTETSLVLLWGLAIAVSHAQDYTYLGCFYDGNRRESLPDLIYCDRTRHPYETCQNVCGPEAQYCQSYSMTIELCRDICIDQNMRYFGLQAGSQCQCGGFFAPYDVLGKPTGLNNTCNTPCRGDSSQMCGADLQTCVYQINEPASDCFNPGYVLNGDQSQQESSLYNATDSIDFSSVCSPPSIKNGADSITCSAFGNWTDPPPTCTVKCATPTAPIYASFSPGQTLNDSYAVDDVVLYDCDNDLARTNQILICGYYGDWEIWFNTMDCSVSNVTQNTNDDTTILVSTQTDFTTLTLDRTQEQSSTTEDQPPSSTSDFDSVLTTTPATQFESTDGGTSYISTTVDTMKPQAANNMQNLGIIIGACAAVFVVGLLIGLFVMYHIKRLPCSTQGTDINQSPAIAKGEPQRPNPTYDTSLAELCSNDTTLGDSDKLPDYIEIEGLSDKDPYQTLTSRPLPSIYQDLKNEHTNPGETHEFQQLP